MRLLFVTDAWTPQVNGVVRTAEALVAAARAEGHQVEVVQPGLFSTFPCPTEPKLRLAALPGLRLAQRFDRFDPDAVHLMTEGPLGLATRRACLKRGFPFTTSLCTRFPEYLERRVGIPAAWSWRALRRFHAPARRTFVATPALQQELRARGFEQLALVPRGVDLAVFSPRGKGALAHLPRPIHLSVGRVAQEKNLQAFLELDLPGSKVVVGDGPARAELVRRHPHAHFLGALRGDRLAAVYSAADVFVFPSRTDTFGLVMLEALACGVPVAAFPVRGPLDVIGDAPAGVLDEDLASACSRALEIPAATCLAHARRFTWGAVGRAFLAQLAWREPRGVAA